MARDNMRDVCFATVNLLNLQVPGGITYNEDAPAIADTPSGREEYNRKINWTARALERLDADVICFQELWSEQALRDVFAQTDPALGSYDLVARDAPGRGKPQVAMAVRRDRNGEPMLVSGEWIADFPQTFSINGIREKFGAEEEISISIGQFSRPVCRVVLQPQGRSPKPPKVTAYGCHFKSKGGTSLREVRRGDTVLDHHYGLASSAVSHTRRILEAGALRAMLDAEMTSLQDEDLSPTVVMGDLNDGTHSISTELLTAQPGYRLVAKSRAGRTADKGLYTAETLQQYRSQRHVYYTYIFRNKLESLDQILVSEEFYDHSEKRHWSFRELEVINDHLNTSEVRRKEETGAGDHGLVRAYFDWNPIEDEIEKMS